MHAQSGKASEIAAEKARELATYQGLSASEKLFRIEKEVIGEMIAIKCPRCTKKYADFDVDISFAKSIRNQLLFNGLYN